MGLIKNTRAANKAGLRFSAVESGALTFTDDKLGFFRSTPVAQQTAIANITTVATTGSLPTANGSVTIANASTPTVGELQEYCVELEAKVEAILAVLRTVGIIAS